MLSVTLFLCAAMFFSCGDVTFSSSDVQSDTVISVQTVDPAGSTDEIGDQSTVSESRIESEIESDALSETAQDSENVSSAETESETDEITTEAIDYSESAIVRSIWSVSGDGLNGFYLFFPDGNGVYYGKELGEKSPFEFRIDGIDISIRFEDGRIYDGIVASIILDTMTLRFNEGASVQTLVDLNRPDGDGFDFYCDRELIKMADAYLRSNGMYIPNHIALDGEENNVVSIHLYDETEDHIATVNWFYIDRFTGEGEDFLGQRVDLSPFGELSGTID